MDCIKAIVENVENQEYGFSILYPTGPGLLGCLYEKKRDTYKLPKIDLIHEESVEPDGVKLDLIRNESVCT
jgi:hypothetical protein